MAGEVELFDRKYRIQIRDIQIENTLRCVFKVTKHLKREPNKISLKIYNLTEAHRQALENIPERPKDLTLAKLVADLTANNVVRLEAGYASGMSQIYLGEVRHATTEQAGADVITTVVSGDGAKDLSARRVNVPIGAKTPAMQALRAVVAALGCGEGNLASVEASLRLSGAANMYPKGGVLHGPASDEIDAICKAAQLDWSIQDGKLLILDKGKALAGSALSLSSETGLVGSPSIDSKGIVSAKAYMIPDLYPGRFVVFDAKNVKGGYRVEECEYSGDTHGTEWYISVKCAKVK